MKSSLPTRFLIAAITASTLVATTAAGAINEVFIDVPTAGTTRTFQGGMVSGVTYTTLSSPMTFNSLGFIDLIANPINYNQYYGFDGLLGSYQVGIWINSAPTTLLASTTVTSASTIIGDSFRYAPIPATTIPANTAFTIAALLPASMPDAWLIDAVSVNTTNITGPGSGRRATGATSLVFPTESNGTGVAIVNASTTIVPEPATAGLLIAGCAAMLLRRRRVTTGTPTSNDGFSVG